MIRLIVMWSRGWLAKLRPTPQQRLREAFKDQIEFLGEEILSFQLCDFQSLRDACRNDAMTAAERLDDAGKEAAMQLASLWDSMAQAMVDIMGSQEAEYFRSFYYPLFRDSGYRHKDICLIEKHWEQVYSRVGALLTHADWGKQKVMPWLRDIDRKTSPSLKFSRFSR